MIFRHWQELHRISGDTDTIILITAPTFRYRPPDLPLMVYWVIAFLIIVALIAAAVFLVIDLARLPGEIAARRGHPHADAVRIAGVIGIFTGILWALALIWAHVPYPSQTSTVLHGTSGSEKPKGASQVAEGAP